MFRTVWHLKDSAGQNHRAATQEELYRTLDIIRDRNDSDSEIEIFATIEVIEIGQYNSLLGNENTFFSKVA